MVNTTNLTDMINNVDINKGMDYLSWLSKTATGKIVEFLSSKGFQVSTRWASLMILLVSLLLIWISMKITKPILKWAIIILAVVLIGGIILPFW